MAVGDWGSLPRWAQDEHDRVLRERIAYEQRLRALETTPGTEPGEISHAPLGQNERRRGIPRGDRVRFHLREAGDFVDVGVEGDRIVLFCYDGNLVIRPGRASNSIRIDVEPAGQ